MAKRIRDTDEKCQRKKNMRLRFKKLVRAVMLNQQWLDEPEEQGIVMNAKKNVAFLIRQKRKTGLLTVAEKALLRTPHAYRTIEERKKLCLIVSGLSCFNNIPPKLRARLIPVLKFATIGGDRVLIRQGDQPIYVYFMISGEVEMKKSIYDKNTRKITLVSEAIMGAGDIIGEVELLEDCTRINTYVALSPCEVLSITDDDFRSILGPYMIKQWHEKKIALRSLNYFDFLTDEQIVRACNYCQLAQYDPLQSIYSEDRGAVSCVHFILSGECVILQCLKMLQVVKADGTRTFELINVKETGQNLFENPSKSMRALSTSFIDYGNTKDKMLVDSVFNINDLLASSSEFEDEEALQQKKAKRKMGLREIEAACGFIRNDMAVTIKKMKLKSIVRRRTTVVPRRLTTYYPRPYVDESESIDEDTSFNYIEEDYVVEEERTDSEAELMSIRSTKISRASISRRNTDASRRSTVGKPLPIIKQSPKTSRIAVRIETEDSVGVISDSEDFSSSGSSHVFEMEKDSQIIPTETRFIDVGSLTYGGIFGLGEKMAHRVIMARTVVQCLLLPRYWLFEEEQNPGHIWKRRRFYLEGSIPSREELFKDFIKTRRWENFKRDYVQSTLNPNSVNSTQPEDIPIICRIVETRDDI
ncbi:uncharacterized protein LOC115766334 [Drosophila novamexicana]|uniref:uncharacterized protein LOC115766334 n=1 Tax=Drosophila novamexicana TaxID=47314 RepID=UPI0011E5E12C|nr:uncharacterized protein LOC115766334 [Drosophila novamexicana]